MIKISLDDKVLKVIKDSPFSGGTDEWFIASSIYPWDKANSRSKHGAWIRAVISAGQRLQKNGLVGCYIVSHGMPGYNAPQTRLWFAKELRK